MENINRFDLMIEAMTELVQEKQVDTKPPLPKVQPALLSLTSTLANIWMPPRDRPAKE